MNFASVMRLILYSKPGCHLCEGLQEKLEQVHSLPFALEIRDITTREDWLQQYQYEIPVLVMEKDARAEEVFPQSPDPTPQPLIPNPQPLIPNPPIRLPRLSPRASVAQLEQMLQKFLNDPAQ